MNIFTPVDFDQDEGIENHLLKEDTNHLSNRFINTNIPYQKPVVLPIKPIHDVVVMNPTTLPQQKPPQQKPPKPTVKPKPSPAVSIQSVVDAWVNSALNPIIGKPTAFYKGTKNLTVLTSPQNVASLNTLLRDLVTLKTYFDLKSKKGTGVFDKELNKLKAAALDIAIKNISSSYEKAVKALGGNVTPTNTSFAPSDINKIGTIPLNWSGSKVQASYVVFQSNDQHSKPPVNTTNEPDDQGTQSDSGNGLWMWLLAGAGVYYVFKKKG